MSAGGGHESCGEGGKGQNVAVHGGKEEVGWGSRDEWGRGGVGVWSNLLKNRFMSFTYV